MSVRVRWLLPLVAAWLAVPTTAAEFAVLTEKTWDAFVPKGKEVDAIYGDYVVRNGRWIATIAQGQPWRNANMTVRQVGGCVIDLTVASPQSDQLSAYYPGVRRYDYRLLRVVLTRGGVIKDQEGNVVRRVDSEVVVAADELAERPVRLEGPELQLVFAGVPRNAQWVPVELTYTVRDGADGLRITTVARNTTKQPKIFFAIDDFRADRTFTSPRPGLTRLVWVYDKWWGQAYGVVSGHRMRLSGNPAAPRVIEFLVGGGRTARLNVRPGQEITIDRELIPASTLLELRGLALARDGVPVVRHRIAVVDGHQQPVKAADVTVELLRGEGRKERAFYGNGRTDDDGKLEFGLPPGTYQLTVTAVGFGRREITLTVPKEAGGAREIPVGMDTPAYVVADIRSESGGPIPCKVQFIGINGTRSPFWFNDTGEHLVHNLYYSHNGRFRVPIPPGEYRVIISHGPEYDAVEQTIKVSPGAEVPVRATLKRVVQTPGWVSADFHSHSSPSGDNVSSQLGRVLNLLCEHIEFAPCTEHNRLDTYVPHLKRLGVEHLMATCVGIELTGRPGSINHQNAFPLIRKPRTQDNGAPQPDEDPEVQIRRLALWDNGSEKLVQTNHPDIGEMFFDRDGDGRYDGGYKGMFEYQDVIEVHPPETLLSLRAYFVRDKRKQNNRIFNWLQMINLGHYIPGVVNTDAHYNYHGSGWLRNYIKSSTDDPAKINVMEMVRNAERGHIIMTNGPYLEVTARTGGSDKVAIAGDTLVARDGKVQLWIRVQCPNWFDIDRVQVLRNGWADPKLNWTRSKNPDAFGSGVVKFERTIELELKTDEHLIVVAMGEHSGFGDVMGPAHKNRRPTALNNPIFIDVDGDGFEPSGDPLGFPYPVKSGRPAVQ